MLMDGVQDGACFGDWPRPLGVWSKQIYPSNDYDENALAITKSGSVLGWTLLDASCSSEARVKAASEAREDRDEAWDSDGSADSNDLLPEYAQARALKLTRCAY